MPVFVPGLAHVMGWLHLWCDDAASALAWFERESSGETWLVAQTLPGLGAALVRLGRVDDARCALDRAASLARRLDMPRVLADALEQQANLAGVERAIELHHEALALRVDHGLRTLYVDSLDALVALTEPTPEVVRVLSSSETVRNVMGYPRGTRRQMAYTVAVNRLRATLGERVVDQAWAEGAELSLEQAVAYMRRRRGARKRPSTGWNSLTPTELQVVQLVVDGLNNLDVGARLFMSRGTVKTHLSHVYTKLGVSNRTELATVAAARFHPPPAPGGSGSQ
jgi:DNA-binding NarL/FixJ family response regulator